MLTRLKIDQASKECSFHTVKMTSLNQICMNNWEHKDQNKFMVCMTETNFSSMLFVMFQDTFLTPLVILDHYENQMSYYVFKCKICPEQSIFEFRVWQCNPHWIPKVETHSCWIFRYLLTFIQVKFLFNGTLRGCDNHIWVLHASVLTVLIHVLGGGVSWWCLQHYLTPIYWCSSRTCQHFSWQRHRSVGKNLTYTVRR